MAGMIVTAWLWAQVERTRRFAICCSVANSAQNIPDRRSGAPPSIAQPMFRRVTRFMGRAIWRGAIRSQTSRCTSTWCRTLPEFVHLADGQLPAVIREQLEDFGGFIGD